MNTWMNKKLPAGQHSKLHHALSFQLDCHSMHNYTLLL